MVSEPRGEVTLTNLFSPLFFCFLSHRPTLPARSRSSQNKSTGESKRGGLVAGRLNTISGQGATVTGGSGNVASGSFASVSGGAENLASGGNASISGG